MSENLTGYARACPDCGALVPLLSWPGEEACPSCGRILYVNASGQVGRSPVGNFPD